MPTFLTTRRMPPELAARVEASVRGKKRREEEGGGSRTWGTRLVALLRFAVVLAVVAIAASVVLLRRRDRRDFERARAALLDTARAASAPLTPEDEGAVARIESWLTRSSRAYEGDLIADELRPPGALAAALARPAVYVRGPIAQLSAPAGIAEAAAASLKDSFLVCLLEPPASRAEKTLLAKVHEAFSNGAERHSPGVRRLREAQVGLSFFQAPWSERVRSAKGPEDLELLHDELEKARDGSEAARRALKAVMLVFAIDEPGDDDAETPTELDGERPHPVRVGLVDLTSSKVLLRMRKRVDPSWISATKRPLYASGLDGCALAFDVREAIASKSP